MRIDTTNIAEVVKITPTRNLDSRGYFCELFREDIFREHVIDARFIQDNQSVSLHSGTVRGLHFQRPPFAQGKLVNVVVGSVFDVAVDLRRASPTFGQWAATHLSAENGAQLWIPEGFAHGFMTLEEHTIVQYKVTAPYSAAHEGGILWNDPDIGIAWPDHEAEVSISPKDRTQPRLRHLSPTLTNELMGVA